MSQQAISGGVCSREERVLWRYIVPIGLGVVAILAVILLAEAFRNKNSIGFWLFALAWLAFVIYLIVSYRRIRITDRLEFGIEQGRVTNSWPKGNIIALDLEDSYFCTLFTCAFAYGTATKKKSYYLFSHKPFNLGSIEEAGFHALEKINKNKIIIIPQTDVTDTWVRDVLRLTNIPAYPAVAFKQGRIK